jgi:hypothetical protein
MDSRILMIQDSILACSPDPRIPHTAPQEANVDAQLCIGHVEGPQLKKRVTICILFDGGVNLDEDVSALISEDGTKLKITCKGIKRLNDVDTLHEFHRTAPNHGLPEYHPQVIAFQEFFR